MPRVSAFKAKTKSVLGSPCSIPVALDSTRDRVLPALSGCPHKALFDPVALTSRFAEEEIRWW